MVKNLRPKGFLDIKGRQKLGGGQKAELYMRLFRPTETGRVSEGQISLEAIKADRPLPNNLTTYNRM